MKGEGEKGKDKTKREREREREKQNGRKKGAVCAERVRRRRQPEE